MPRRVTTAGRPAYVRPNYGRPVARRRRVRFSMTRRQGRLLALILVGVVVMAVVVYLFRLKVITVVGTTRLDAVRTNTEHVIKSHLLWGNLLTLDSGGLGTQILSADPQLKQVSVRRHWPQGIMVTASDKRPSLIWDTGGEKYLIDADGTTIAPASGAGLLPTIKDDTNLPTSPGHRVVVPEFIQFVRTLVSALPRQGIVVTSYEVHETTFDLYVTTNHNYQIIFDTSRAAGDEVADLKSVMAVLAAQKLTPSAYIDLRVAGKAYYK